MRFAAGGICRYVISSRGSSVKETSWAISVSVLMRKEPVLLITIGIDDVCVSFPVAMVPDGLPERGEDAMYVCRGFVHVRVSRVFALYDLEDAAVCVGGVRGQLTGGLVDEIPDSSDYVRLVVCGPVGFGEEVLIREDRVVV